MDLNNFYYPAYKDPARDFSIYNTKTDQMLFFYEDFLGLTFHTDTIWETVEVNLNTAMAVTTDIGGGVITSIIDADNNAEDAVLYWGDITTIPVNKGAFMEFRARFTTIPTTGVAVVMGMAGAHNLDKDTVAESAWFRLQASASLLLETDDTTNNNDDQDTGEDLVVDTWYTFQIDFNHIDDVRFYLDGSRLLPGTNFDMSNLTDTEAMMQPYFSLDKASGTGVGTLQLDYVKIWSPRA